ncbi:MAG: EamA family transporter [Desulfofustis sp.]|nr:EamA family transporter [Desulfofustis sp.]
MNLKGYGFIVAAASCWAFIGIFSSIAFAQGVAPMEVAFWRALFAWLCFGGQALILGQTRLEKRDIPLLGFFGVFGIFLFYVSYQYAVKTGGAALAAVLLYTAPAWVVVCSVFIFRERLSVYKVLAVVLVITGVYLISRSGGTKAGEAASSLGLLALLSGLTAGLCYSLYYTVGKYFSGRYTSANLFLYVLPVGIACILPFVDFAPKNLSAWGALIALATVSTYVANFCYYQGVKYLEAGRASIVATLEPVVATAAAYVILGESLSLLGYLGAAVIITAVMITILAK